MKIIQKINKISIFVNTIVNKMCKINYFNFLNYKNEYKNEYKKEN